MAEVNEVDGLLDELRLPRVVCSLLAARGYGNVETAKRFLRPRLEQLSAPSEMKDCSKAAERLKYAIDNHQTIFVHGDYDVDGMASTALLTRVLRELGAENVVPWVPNRMTDGYDLGDAGVRAALHAGANVVVTCDCGTSAHQHVEILSKSGVDVIVTDHHLPSHGIPPSAYAVVNPKREDCESQEKELAAVGVVYKLALALCDLMNSPPLIAHKQLDLVALATIADVAALKGENRILVRYGLRLMAETEHPGIRALIHSSSLDGKSITAGRVGFVLAPRLNAAGRIGDAKLGLSLLLAEDQNEANTIARELEELNKDRQLLDQSVLSDALEQLAKMDLDANWGLVLSADGWHPGVIGIVASRIVEMTGRPTILVAFEGEVGRGSGRSISAFDLHAALSASSDCFVRYGGHKAAAGLTIEASNLEEFRDRFNRYAMEVLTEDDLVPDLRIDMVVGADEIGPDLEGMLRHFEPFGIGNPSPVFSLSSVAVASSGKRVGKDGVRFAVELPNGNMPAIAWGLPPVEQKVVEGDLIDMAFRIERDEYMGRSSLQLRVHSVRPAGSSDLKELK